MATPRSTSPSATAAPAQQSAAIRVFAIPELLEEILVDLADLEVEEKMIWTRLHDLHCNELALFPIQRVSTAFRHTIQGSKKLKQLMFLEPRDNSDFSWPEHIDHDPLYWICHVMEQGDENNGRYWLLDVIAPGCHVMELHGDTPTIKMQVQSAPLWGESLVPNTVWSEHDGSLARTFESTLKNGWERPEASWRNIKISNSLNPAYINFVIEGESDWQDLKPDIGTPSASWLLKGDTTLAHVWELVHSFLQTIDQLREKRAKQDEEFEEEKLRVMVANLSAAHCVIGETRFW